VALLLVASVALDTSPGSSRKNLEQQGVQAVRVNNEAVEQCTLQK
jgi:hypothetical protein